MVGFTKAEPKQARLKVGMYGPTGSGKTFTTLLWAEGLAKRDGKRIAYVDTERGTDFYAQKVAARSIHPEAFDFDCIYTKSLAEVTAAIDSLDPQTHGVVVIDSISHLWEAAMDAYEGKRTAIDSIPLHAWGSIKKPYKGLINRLIGSPFHVFILGRQKNVFDMEGGDFRKVGVAMRAESETEYEPHLSVRMELRKNQSDPSRSTVLMYVEKDRTGVLAGRTFENPNFTTIKPLLSLLGDIQAESEDEDERQAKDAELLEAEREKKAKKAEKSAEFLAEFQAEISGCQTVQELGATSKAIKKQRRYMTEEHLDALRVLYEQKRAALVADMTPDI